VRAGVSIVHATGTQGSIAFLFDQAETAGERAASGGAGGSGGARTVDLLLHDGSVLPVTMGEQLVSWCLFNVHISGRATLDYTNLCAFAAVGQVLVLFGPAGSRGRVSVNGSPLDVDVPAAGAKEPVITASEGLTLVIANEQQIDHVYAVDDGVFVGVLDVSQDGTPVLPPGTRSYFKVMADGSTRTVTPESARTSVATPEAPALGQWSVAEVDEYADGTCPRFAKIDAPLDLTRLGCPYGYGWYRIGLKGGRARKARVMMPYGADRLHVYLDGKPVGVCGEGPGAASSVVLNLTKSPQTLVVLAENLGRFSDGLLLGESKGLWGPIFEVAPISGVKAKVMEGSPLEYLAFRKPLWDASEGDTTSPERVTWTVPHKRKTNVLVRFEVAPPPGSLLLVNGAVLEAMSPAGPRHVVLPASQLGKGVIQLQIALHPRTTEADRDELLDGVTFHECVDDVTAGASFAFAKWEPPSGSGYQAAGGKRSGGTGGGSGGVGGVARWWRGTFTPAETQAALYVECAGLTKGQLYVNGRHAARYFVRTGDGAEVPPQARYRLPRPWLKPKQANELVIFDEHGANPSKTRLVYDRGRAR
jgi:hypothetical protein